MSSIRRALALAVAIAACGGGAPVANPGVSTTRVTTPDPIAPTSTTTPPPETAQPAPSDVDLTRHSVPLEEVYFDTFDGGAVRLSDSDPALRTRLLDAIPPIDEPVYEDPAAADRWLAEADPVVGYVAGGQAYAYPFRILNYHEIVNDTIDGVPVLISYCPLCRSAVVYDRRVDGRELSFGNTSALYENDLVMVDRETFSYWWQVPGEAIVGELTGTSLEVLPSVVAAWGDWKARHSDTRVLSRDTGVAAPYDRDPFLGYSEIIDRGSFPFPVGEAARDGRLAASTMVVGVQANGEVRAYPIEALPGPVNDVVAGTPILVVPAGGGAAVYSPVVDGARLTFEAQEGRIVDSATGSTWSADGVAIAGALKETRLEPLSARTTFWFAMVGAFPDVELWTPQP